MLARLNSLLFLRLAPRSLEDFSGLNVRAYEFGGEESFVPQPEPNDPDAAAAAAAPEAADRVAHRVVARARRTIVLGVIVLLSVCAFAGYVAVDARRVAVQVAHTRSIRNAATQLLVSILEAESAQRGYLLTHQETYLAPYQQAMPAIPAELATLRALAAKDADAIATIGELEQLIRDKSAQMQQSVFLSQQGRAEEALALVRTDLGNQLIVRIGARIGDLRARFDRQSGKGAAAQRFLSQALLVTIAAAALLITLLATLVYRDGQRNLRLLVARKNRLRQLMRTLSYRVERRTKELALVNARLAVALQASRVVVFSQNTDFVYTWINQDTPDHTVAEIIGRVEEEVIPKDAAIIVNQMKRKVLETGEMVRGEVLLQSPRATRWYELTIVQDRDEHGQIKGIIAAAVNITERKEFEARIRLLMRELTHRCKNLLAVVQAVIRQTATGSTSLNQFLPMLYERLHALAGSHDLLVQDAWQGVELHELIRSQLGHYADVAGTQVELIGGSLRLPPTATQNIGMALHELATNATKYGALSTQSGKVTVTWSQRTGPDGQITGEIVWQESGGPPVTPPKVTGFGRMVVERVVAQAVSGKVDLQYLPEGVIWRLTFPYQPIDKEVAEFA
jgi:two-component sensor histidine kinase/CHASE3 domain sensor protein